MTDQTTKLRKHRAKQVEKILTDWSVYPPRLAKDPTDAPARPEEINTQEKS